MKKEILLSFQASLVVNQRKYSWTQYNSPTAVLPFRHTEWPHPSHPQVIPFELCANLLAWTRDRRYEAIFEAGGLIVQPRNASSLHGNQTKTKDRGDEF